MRIRTLIPALVAAAIAATITTVAAPAVQAESKPIGVTLSCTGPVTVTADPGDVIEFTFADDCSEGAIFYNSNGIDEDFTAPGFLAWPSAYEDLTYNYPGANPGDWFVFRPTAKTFQATLVDPSNGAQLKPGAVISQYYEIGVWDYGVIWAGPRNSKDLTVQHLAQGRPADDATCPAGYSPSWAMWPNHGTGGPVCVKSIYAYYPAEAVTS